MMDRLVEAADTTLDPVARRAIYSKVQQLAASELPYVPLWWLDTITVANRRLSGFEPRPNGSLIGLATANYAASSRPVPLQ
jgi:ABC-type transport system substrate-binding protein